MVPPASRRATLIQPFLAEPSASVLELSPHCRLTEATTMAGAMTLQARDVVAGLCHLTDLIGR